MKKKCLPRNKEVEYPDEECKKCDFYNPYTVCTYRSNAKVCSFDGKKCNSSAGFSSIYDCRHDYGFELRKPICEVERR